MGFKLNDFLPTGSRKSIAPVEILPLKILQEPDNYGSDHTYHKNEYISEAHVKLAAPLAALALTLLALSVFLISGFNRRGYFNTIIVAIILAILVQSLTSAFRTTVVNDSSLYWILYCPAVLCICVSICLIIFSININSPYSRIKKISHSENP